jgi:hypothetical protein
MQQQGRGNKKLQGLMDTPGKPGMKGEDQGTAPNNQDCLLQLCHHLMSMVFRE